jgi:hypothetical protein
LECVFNKIQGQIIYTSVQFGLISLLLVIFFGIVIYGSGVYCSVASVSVLYLTKNKFEPAINKHQRQYEMQNRKKRKNAFLNSEPHTKERNQMKEERETYGKKGRKM